MDVRFDYLDQTQLRSGTSAVSRGSLDVPNDREIQQRTRNLNYSAYLDYTANADWGVNIQVPYFDRFHTTIAPGDTDISTSHTRSTGDMRVVGRYQGISPDHSVGLQLGLKLPTGGIHNTFVDGPQAGQPLDRGLQPGTGTTDLLAGAYKFGALDRDWDYFMLGMLQLPLNSKEDFKPGVGVNVSFGVQYAGFESWTPRLQINTRVEKRDSGAQADVANSGATLVYLAPGASVRLGKSALGYVFVQIPLYQRVNGLQIEPRFTTSVGVRFEF